MAAATTTASYSFADDDVDRLANCDDQPEFLLLYRRLLQSKGIDPTAVFDAKTTLGSPSDYGAAVLSKVFENSPHALHLEPAYALFKSCNSSSCLRLDSATPLPTSWLKEQGVNSVLTLPKDTLSLFTIAGLDLHAVRSLSSGAALAAPQSTLPSHLENFLQRSHEFNQLLVRFSADTSTGEVKKLADLLEITPPEKDDDPAKFGTAALNKLQRFRAEFQDSILSFGAPYSRSSHSTSTLRTLTFSEADETSLRALPSQMAELLHRFPTWFPQPPMNVTADPSFISLRFLLNTDGIRIFKEFLDIQEAVYAFLVRVAASRAAGGKSGRQNLVEAILATHIVQIFLSHS